MIKPRQPNQLAAELTRSGWRNVKGVSLECTVKKQVGGCGSRRGSCTDTHLTSIFSLPTHTARFLHLDAFPLSTTANRRPCGRWCPKFRAVEGLRPPLPDVLFALSSHRTTQVLSLLQKDVTSTMVKGTDDGCFGSDSKGVRSVCSGGVLKVIYHFK